MEEIKNNISNLSDDVPNSKLYDGDKVSPTGEEQNNMKYVIIKKTNVAGWISNTLLR